MVSRVRGRVDFAAEGFIARFEFDPAIITQIKAIQRRRWLQDKAAWIIEPHWPSVRRLLHIASGLGWEITAKAREAEQRVRLDGESLEYSIDVVHDNLGAAWFQCKVGDDDVLLQQVKAIPGAEWDDSWWIPTDWEQCCGPLLDIVQSDMRLEVSDAAWRLLSEADVTHQFLRSSAPVDGQNAEHSHAAEGEEVDGSDDPAGAGAQVDENGLQELGDTLTRSTPTARKARVSTRSKRPASEPVKKDAGGQRP